MGKRGKVRLGGLLLALLLLLAEAAPRAWAMPGVYTVTDEAGQSFQVVPYTLAIGYHETVEQEQALRDEEGIVYFPVRLVEKYSDYTYYEQERTFREYDRAERASEGFSKAILIDQDQTAFVRAYKQPLKHVFTWQDELYLPIHQLLPLMETYCSAGDGVLYLTTAPGSMADVFHDFSVNDIYFDAATEFDGKPWANLIEVGSAMFFDSFRNLRWDRLLGLGSRQDYRAALLDYITDREGYEKMMEKQGSAYADMGSDMEEMAGTVQAVQEYVGYPMDLFKFAHDAMENAGNLEVFFEIIPEDVYKKIDGAWNAAGTVLSGVKVAMNYALMVEDHVNMLAAVYPKIQDKTVLLNVKTEAVRSVYDNYSEITAGSVMREFLEETLPSKVQGAVTGAVSPEAILAKLSGVVIEKYISLASGVEASDEMALLNHHITLTNDAKEAYQKMLKGSGMAYTGEYIENTRLTAVMTLVSSKKCFEIIRDNNKKNSEIKAYCETRIQHIEDKLIQCYELAYAPLYDGIEYFQAAPEQFQSSIMEATTQANTGAIRGTPLEAFGFAITIPDSWEGRYTSQIYLLWPDQDIKMLELYENSNAVGGYGGSLVTIALYGPGEDYSYLPDYEVLGTLDLPEDSQSMDYTVIAIYPTDVQFTEDSAEAYLAMQKDLKAMYGTIQGTEGNTFIPTGVK